MLFKICENSMKKYLIGLFVLGLLSLVSPSVASAACGDYDNPKSCEGSCGGTKPDGKRYQCKWLDTGCKESAQTCDGSSGGGSAPSTRSCGGCTESATHPGQFSCSGDGYSGVNYAYCGGCVSSCVRGNLLPYGCQQYINEQCGTSTGQCEQITAPITMYYCNGMVTPSSNGCQGNDPVPGGVRWDDVNNTITGDFCGTVQVDDNNGHHCSKVDTGTCGPNFTPAPTAPPQAMCQYIKPYTAGIYWVELTRETLARFQPGRRVRFCAAGFAPGSTGYFDKAQFKINGVTRPETSIHKPGSPNVICDVYTIPTGVTRYTITAKIHHTVLGWK